MRSTLSSVRWCRPSVAPDLHSISQGPTPCSKCPESSTFPRPSSLHARQRSSHFLRLPPSPTCRRHNRRTLDSGKAGSRKISAPPHNCRSGRGFARCQGACMPTTAQPPAHIDKGTRLVVWNLFVAAGRQSSPSKMPCPPAVSPFLDFSLATNRRKVCLIHQ
jgi:hypothetical protein